MANAVPDNPDALLTREELAEALTGAGYPTSPATLATKASRGGGPPYRRYGPRAIYRWGDSLSWAQSRLSPLIRSTSETDAIAAAKWAVPEKARPGRRPRPGHRD